MFLPGLEGQGGFVNAGCSGRSTRIEFALKTHDNWKQLEQMSDKLDEVLVVFEGESYGPPAPDPNLPEAIRKNYHPGWDYTSMTKLVVEAIQNAGLFLRITRVHQQQPENGLASNMTLCPIKKVQAQG